MARQHLADLGADPLDWMQRRRRILENHCDVLAANVAHLGLRQLQEIAALECNAAGRGGGAVIRQNADDGPRQHALAGTGLADDAESLTSLNRERYAVDRPHHAVRRMELRHEMGDLEEGSTRFCHSAPPRKSVRARRRSPIRLMDSTVRNISAEGMKGM